MQGNHRTGVVAPPHTRDPAGTWRDGWFKQNLSPHTSDVQGSPWWMECHHLGQNAKRRYALALRPFLHFCAHQEMHSRPVSYLRVTSNVRVTLIVLSAPSAARPKELWEVGRSASPRSEKRRDRVGKDPIAQTTNEGLMWLWGTNPIAEPLHWDTTGHGWPGWLHGEDCLTLVNPFLIVIVLDYDNVYACRNDGRHPDEVRTGSHVLLSEWIHFNPYLSNLLRLCGRLALCLLICTIRMTDASIIMHWTLIVPSFHVRGRISWESCHLRCTALSALQNWSSNALKNLWWSDLKLFSSHFVESQV